MTSDFSSDEKFESPDRVRHGPVRQRKIIAALRRRAVGPGGLYNVGNIIALLGGITIQSMAVDQDKSLNEIVVQYLFGSPAASYLSLAVLIFLLSGEVYHRAWSQSGEKASRMVRLGDGLSGVAAVVLTVALVQVGDAILGLVGGAMLIIGKFGTAILPERPNAPSLATKSTKLLRFLVVASRGPSLVALGVTIFVLATDGILAEAAMPSLMVLCYLLWLWADILLMRIPTTSTEKAKQPCPLDFMP